MESEAVDVGAELEQAQLATRFPVHLTATGSRYYRTATLKQAARADKTNVGFETVEQIVHWLLKAGPVRLRFRWYSATTKPDTNGRIELRGTKGARVTCLLVGFDDGEPYPFRVLTPFGSGYGQVGRVWLSRDALARVLREGAKVDAPII